MGEAKEYSQGICEDGAAILENGIPLTIEQILEALKELDLARREAGSLAMALWRTHYQHQLPDFALCDSVAGIISQIDNMTTGLENQQRGGRR